MPVIVFFGWIMFMAVAGGIGQTSCYGIKKEMEWREYHKENNLPIYQSKILSRVTEEEIKECLGE